MEPLVKKVKKAYVKEGIRRPKFERFCMEFHLPCKFVEEKRKEDRTTYYRIQTGDWVPSNEEETEDDCYDENEYRDQSSG